MKDWTKDLIVIGAGNVGLFATVSHLMKDKDVVLIDSNDSDFKKTLEELYPQPDPKPFLITAPIKFPELSVYGEGKPFKCKGKHQYRRVEVSRKEGEYGTIINESWVCQCGKSA